MRGPRCPILPVGVQSPGAFLLRCGEKCHCEPGPPLDLESSNLSRHVHALSDAGLIGARKEGVRLMHAVHEAGAFKILHAVREMAGKQIKSGTAFWEEVWQ